MPVGHASSPFPRDSNPRGERFGTVSTKNAVTRRPGLGESDLGGRLVASNAPDTDVLLDEAGAGDSRARQKLLERHRDRLVKMVSVRLDPRLAPRVDPSDIVQEALVHADRKLDGYLRNRPVPFYPWLRRIAWERLVKCHRRHTARRRDVGRERASMNLSESSIREFASRFRAPSSSPSRLAERREQVARAREALQQLPERDREVLVLRYLEQLSTADTAAVLEITLSAAKLRHLRALERLRRLMGHSPEDSP